MLTYLLALVVGLSSFSLYMSAFFYPELYRKGDLAWSGVGLFYALVLWFSAERITGGVLLGQIAGVSLLGWLGWQAAHARWGQASLDQQTEIQTGLEKIISPEQRRKITAQVNQQAGKVKEWGQALLSTAAKAPEVPSDRYQPLKPEDFGQPPVTIETPVAAAASAPIEADLTDEITPAVAATSPELAAPVRTQPKPVAATTNIFKSVTGLFNRPKKNTSTYVRKSAQEQAEEALAAAKEAVPQAVDSVADAAKAAKVTVTEAVVDGKLSLTDTVAVGQATIAETTQTAEANLINTANDLKAAIADAQESRGAIVDQVTAAVTDKLAETQAASEDVVENLLDKIDDTP